MANNSPYSGKAVRDPRTPNPEAGLAVGAGPDPRISPVADAFNVPATVENADQVTALAKGVAPVEPKDQDAYEAYRTQLHTAAKPVISEGVRQELLSTGRSTDPNTGRVIVQDGPDSEPRFLAS